MCHQDVTNSEFVLRSTSGLDGERSLAVGRQATVGQKTIEGTRCKEGSERRESLDSKKSQAASDAICNIDTTLTRPTTKGD